MVLRLLVALVVLVAPWGLVPGAPTAAGAAPARTLSVTGPGASMWPAYAPSVERYGVSTTTETGGGLTVRATTSDPAGRIWIGGVLEPDGEATVTGLADGDEVSVFIEDGAGRSVHSLVYLPAGFPRLEVRTAQPGVSAGHVLLTLNRFSASPATDVYETAVDRNGVPVFVHANRQAPSQDLKATGRGGYQVFRDDAVDDRGSLLVELDEAFRPVRSMRTAPPLTRTDAHDAILLPDGSRIMGAYEPDPANHGREDAVIQHIAPDGTVVLTWNSADHMRPVDPTLTGAAREQAMRATDTMNPFVGDTPFSDPARPVTLRQDYAHVNSWELVDGGQNLLLSFRHTSSLMKVAWVGARTDGRRPGEVIWRLGGKLSDFTFVDDPYLGPCAQHTGRQLANGNILIFDNGSPEPGATFPDSAHCPDPQDPTGEPVGRDFSRVTEYAIDEDAMTATLVREFTRTSAGASDPWFALFAGGVERLPGGHDLIAWASARQAVATEMDPATGEVLWELWDAGDHGASPYFSYRAAKAEVADVLPPTMSVQGPADGVQVTQWTSVHVTARCSDRGGSSLQQCGVPGGRLDTSVPGEFTWTPVARDGAGNEVVAAPRRYTVVPAPPAGQPRRARPDALVRSGKGRWVGDDVYGARQQVRADVRRSTERVRIRVQNDGDAGAHVEVRGPGSDRRFGVRWLRGSRDVTRKVVRGGLGLRLAPGVQVTLHAVVTRRRAGAGAVRTLRVRVVSRDDRTLRDQVAVRVRATGRR